MQKLFGKSSAKHHWTITDMQLEEAGSDKKNQNCIKCKTFPVIKK